MPIKIIARNGWTTIEAKNMVDRRTPVPVVFFGYTRKDYSRPAAKVSPGPRPNTDQCMAELAFLLRGDLFQKSEIRYNFLLGPDGNVYEGRGWMKAPRLPTKVHRFTFHSLFITFIGDFSGEPPSQELFNLRQEFLKFGVENNYIRDKFYLVTLHSPMSYNSETFTLAN